jgi:hypothetical protein
MASFFKKLAIIEADHAKLLVKLSANYGTKKLLANPHIDGYASYTPSSRLFPPHHHCSYLHIQSHSHSLLLVCTCTKLFPSSLFYLFLVSLIISTVREAWSTIFRCVDTVAAKQENFAHSLMKEVSLALTDFVKEREVVRKKVDRE